MKAKTSTQLGVTDLRKDDGTKTTSDREKAEVLNRLFKSVFTAKDDGALLDPPQYTFSNELNDFEITEEKVRKLLASLQTNKVAGPDEINPAVFVELVDVLACPTTRLFRLSLVRRQNWM